MVELSSNLQRCCKRLTACLDEAKGSKLEALDAWADDRGDATISVGYVAATNAHICVVQAHGQSFSSTSYRGGFEGTWSSIGAAVRACESYERTQRFAAWTRCVSK